jgi:hypothetical protein
MGDQILKYRLQRPKAESVIRFTDSIDIKQTTSFIPAHLVEKNISDKALIGLVRDLNNKFNTDTSQGQITWRAASPNWLVGGAPGQSGTGGPGSWPVMADPPFGENWKFQLWNTVGGIAPSAIGENGQDVHVAILDTMPTLQAMKKAYTEWQEKHPLIKSLLRDVGNGGPLNVYPASDEDLQQVQDYDLRGHRYLMPDHGLFIAGIIHTLAPEAKIHLFEVLNSYGVGSIETIARGVLKALDKIPKGCPLIVNCSFMLSLPPHGAFDPDFHFDIRDPETWRKLPLTTQKIFEVLSNRENTVLVAAAGNDAFADKNNNDEHVRPDARYPAAFDKVLGIGGLSKQRYKANDRYTAATYSNLSDQPPTVSYITLGGEPGPRNGVLGVFIGQFPEYKETQGCLAFLWQMILGGKKKQQGYIPGEPTILSQFIKYKPNPTGWAWWAGTSFATPIISGILAAGHGQPGLQKFNFEDAKSYLRNLVQQNGTEESEPVILITQS